MTEVFVEGPVFPPRRRAALLAAAMLFAVGSPSLAQDSPLRSAAKSAGLAMDPAPPADFVIASRPAGEPTPIPIFKAPDEPPSRVKSRAELKAMDATLESAGKTHDAIRAAFPPSAKAMAEAEAARKSKAKKRRAASPISAQ